MPESRSAPIPRVVLLCGEDPDLKREAIADLRARAMKSGALDWGVVNADSSGLPALLSAAGTPGLFSSMTVRVVERADLYFKRGASRGHEEALRRFSGQTAPPACVILVTSLKPKAAEALGVGRVVPCWPLEDREGRRDLTRWTLARARSLGKTLDAAAASSLLARTGNALSRISDALSTLTLYVGSRPSISASDVEALIGSEPQGSAFAVAEATSLGEAPRSLRLLRQRLEGAESAPGLLAVLVFHWRRLAQARSRVESGASAAEAADAAGVRYPFLAPFLRALSRLSSRDVGAALGLLGAADRRIKGGGGGDRAVLERAVLRLCALGERPHPRSA